MASSGKRAGAGRKPSNKAKRATVLARVDASLRGALEASASDRQARMSKHWSLSSEIEYRLRHSLEFAARLDELVRDNFGDRETFALLRLVGTAITRATEHDAKARRTKWYDDPQLFELAADVAIRTLASFAPPERARSAAPRSKAYTKKIRIDAVAVAPIAVMGQAQIDDLCGRGQRTRRRLTTAHYRSRSSKGWVA